MKKIGGLMAFFAILMASGNAQNEIDALQELENKIKLNEAKLKAVQGIR
jgi:hypothetical protein